MTLRHNFTDYLKALRILFLAMLLGQTMILVILWFFVQPSRPPGMEVDTFVYFALAVWLGSQTAAFLLVGKRIAAARALPDLRKKIVAYRAALIMRYALMEGSTLICAIIFFFSVPNYILLVAAVIGIAIFATQAPSRDKLIRDLDLSMKEQMKLDDPEFIIAQTD